MIRENPHQKSGAEKSATFGKAKRLNKDGQFKYAYIGQGGKGMKSEVYAFYDRDSKRYHRFLIEQNQGITGTVYEKVMIYLKTQKNQSGVGGRGTEEME